MSEIKEVSILENKPYRKESSNSGFGFGWIIYFLISVIVVAWAISDNIWVGLLFVFIFAIIPVGISDSKKKEAAYKDKISIRDAYFEKNIKKNQDFTISKEFKAADLESSISVDENKNSVCIMYSGMMESKIYSYKDILEVEIVEDGVSLTKTSRGSQLGGALIGSVLAGGVGAIIGGLSGEKVQTERIKRIDLKLIVNDTDKPLILINFMNNHDGLTGTTNKEGEKKDSKKYMSAIEQVRYWHALISVLIKRADEEDSSKETQSTPTNIPAVMASNVADELTKLASLHKEGYITKDEFEKQKNKLIG